jgi:hypothetical protein
MKPLVDQTAKEGKDKKVVFECIFSKPNGKPKWFLKKDVFVFNDYFLLFIEIFNNECVLIGNLRWISPQNGC